MFYLFYLMKQLTKKELIFKIKLYSRGNSMKKKNGFTLIELLAVIIILGVLMIIAIPSVTKYIDDSRKNGYVSTAKNIVNGVRNMLYSGELNFDDKNVTYYVDAECVKTDNAYKSPYGDFTNAYVLVTVSNDNYEYYWTSVDEAGRGVKKITNVNELDEDDIVSDILSSEIETNIAIEDREKVALINSQCELQGVQNAAKNVTRNGIPANITYPDGKTKATVVKGDLVKIEDEQFYVIKNEGGRVTLISRYNLNVGDNKKTDVPEGIQNKDVRGFMYASYIETYGGIPFSNTNYWYGKVGTTYSGNYCRTISETNCASVYDRNSLLYSYVENYKKYLIEKDAIIKEARLLTLEEAVELGCGNSGRCYDAPSWLAYTGFWLATAYNNEIWVINGAKQIMSFTYTNSTDHGVRPVIVI